MLWHTLRPDICQNGILLSTHRGAECLRNIGQNDGRRGCAEDSSAELRWDSTILFIEQIILMFLYLLVTGVQHSSKLFASCNGESPRPCKTKRRVHSERVVHTRYFPREKNQKDLWIPHCTRKTEVQCTENLKLSMVINNPQDQINLNPNTQDQINPNPQDQ